MAFHFPKTENYNTEILSCFHIFRLNLRSFESELVKLLDYEIIPFFCNTQYITNSIKSFETFCKNILYYCHLAFSKLILKLSCNTPIIYGCMNTRNTLRLLSSGTKLYYLWVKGYSIWGERDTIFLCWLLLHLPQTTCGTPLANSWSGLGGPRKSTFPFGGRNWTHYFFSNPPNPQPTLPVHDVHHTPWSHFLSGVYFDICEWRILPARASTPALMFAPN